jgi:hypothetical protein
VAHVVADVVADVVAHDFEQATHHASKKPPAEMRAVFV